MKKIIQTLCTLCLSISLCACSSNTNKEYALDFFSALDKTLDMNSGHIQATFHSNSEMDSTIQYDIQFNQEHSLQLACDIDLRADGNKNDSFLNFYIRDGKTYLKSGDTTSQSVVENIGLKKEERLSFSNPFLSFTDDELMHFFQSATKKDTSYKLVLEPSSISSYLDALGSISIEDAFIEAIIEDGYIQNFDLTITGMQDIESQKVVIDIRLHCLIDQINTLESVSFPENLESY